MEFKMSHAQDYKIFEHILCLNIMDCVIECCYDDRNKHGIGHLLNDGLDQDSVKYMKQFSYLDYSKVCPGACHHCEFGDLFSFFWPLFYKYMMTISYDGYISLSDEIKTKQELYNIFHVDENYKGDGKTIKCKWEKIKKQVSEFKLAKILEIPHVNELFVKKSE